MLRFHNREDAGTQLASMVRRISTRPQVVMAIPRGGFPVAAIVSRSLQLPLQTVPICRLALENDPENPFGCVTAAGDPIVNQALAGQQRLDPAWIHRLARQAAAGFRLDLARWGVPLPDDLSGKSILIVDDGMHTGWTMYSAIETLRQAGADPIAVAVPVTHFRSQRFILAHCEELITLHIEGATLYTISRFYQDFAPVTDEQIRAAAPPPGA
jgi:predicted phosphoribosyltransferase